MTLGKKVVSKKQVKIETKSIKTLITLFENTNLNNALVKSFAEISKFSNCEKDENQGIKNKNNNFENAVQDILIKNGFSKIDDINKSLLKKLVSGENHNLDIPNLTFIHQAFGTQNPPDYIIFFNNKAIFIECKSGDDKPTFNTRYPEGNNVYLFFHRKKSEMITFLGRDIMDEKTIEILKRENEKVEKAKKESEAEFKALGKSYNKYGFYNYQRNMYSQNKSYATDDNDRIIDWISNPERPQLETNVFNFIKSI